MTPETGRYRYVHEWVHGGKREAQRAVAELIAEVDRGGHREQGRHTVAELLERWMSHIEAQGRAPSTLARYRSAITANINPRLGSVQIGKLSPSDLDGFYTQLSRSGLTPLSVRKSHAILSAALNQAVRWGWIDAIPSTVRRRQAAADERSTRPRRRSSAVCSKPASRVIRTLAA